MVFDTDIIIWVQRGDARAARLIERAETRAISTQSYLELLQCASNKKQLKLTRDFLRASRIAVFPLTENIGHRASIYIEQYGLSHGLRAGDAIIAATTVENAETLSSSNAKHYRMLPDLDFKEFKPSVS